MQKGGVQNESHFLWSREYGQANLQTVTCRATYTEPHNIRRDTKTSSLVITFQENANSLVSYNHNYLVIIISKRTQNGTFTLPSLKASMKKIKHVHTQCINSFKDDSIYFQEIIFISKSKRLIIPPKHALMCY